LPDLDFACGLGTVTLLEGDVVDQPLVPEAGVLRVRRPEPSFELLKRFAPDRDVAAGLLRRVRWAAEVLA
jgi:O-succinylbenzoate synthase